MCTCSNVTKAVYCVIYCSVAFLSLWHAPNHVAITTKEKKESLESVNLVALHAAYTIVPLEGGSMICVESQAHDLYS